MDRYTAAGEPAGDTWHGSIEEAKEQAVDEFKGMLGEWLLVPDGVANDDLLRFAEENSHE